MDTTRQQRWHDRAYEFATYFRSHEGAPPKTSSLGEWRRLQHRHATPEQKAYLDAIAPGWEARGTLDGYDFTFFRRANYVIEATFIYGRVPLPEDGPEGIWLRSWRQVARRTPDPNPTARALRHRHNRQYHLDTRLPGWETRDDIIAAAPATPLFDRSGRQR